MTWSIDCSFQSFWSSPDWIIQSESIQRYLYPRATVTCIASRYVFGSPLQSENLLNAEWLAM
ncbi:hypothetical protein CH063_11976, partial [Colletotrichum higginsianum]